MSDLGWYFAAALGFALVCVIGVVWMLSKRTVNVTQVQENHAAPVVVNAGGDGAGLGLAPRLIGGVFKMLMAGIVLTMIANLVIAAFNGLGTGLQAIGNGLSQQAQPQQIVVNYPTALPVPTAVPVPTALPLPTAVPVPQVLPAPVVSQPDMVPVIVFGLVVLAVAAVGLWGYVAVTLLQRRTIKRPNVISQQRNVSAREVYGVADPIKTNEVRNHVR